MDIKFRCDLCIAGASSYTKWLVHLTTEKHQTKLQQNQDLIEIELAHPNFRDKAVLVRRIPYSTPLMDVATYFSLSGSVRNIIYRGPEEACDSNAKEPTMHVVLVYELQEAVRKVTSKVEHLINGNRVYARMMHGSSGYGSSYDEEESFSNIQAEPIAQSSVVKMDLREFETEKQKNVFENANEYQRIASQMKDDLSELKLEEQVDGFCQLLCLSQEQLQKRVDLGEQLLEVLHHRFSDCSIYSFGLDYIGLSTDIDTMNVVVDPFGKMTEDCGAINTIVPACQTSLANQVFDLLKQEQYKLKFCRDVEIKLTPWAFSDSKIQKISFVHRDSGVLCNLVIENFIIVQESRLLKFLSSLDPRFPSLLCFARFFGSVYHTLQSPNECFRNQSMVWLMFYFLASKKIVPTVQELISLSNVPLIVENMDISFCKNKEIIMYKKAPFMDDPSIRSYSTLSLLNEFFQLMATADLKQNVVCPGIGKLVPVNAFGRQLGANFPHELRQRYLFNADGTNRQRRFYSGSPMGLQDPLDLTTNLTEHVSFVEVTRFQDLCSRAAKALGEILESGSGEVVEIFTDLFGNRIIEVGEKIFIPMASQSESSESEDEESVKEFPMEVQEPEEDSGFELDHEDDEVDDEYTFQDIRKSRIGMSPSLKKFFEKAIDQAMAGETEENKLSVLDIRKKFQVLWLQYLIEFNSRFWSECFGFTVEAYSDQIISPEPYSKSGSELLMSLSLKEIFDLIKTDEQGYGLEFRCELVDQMSDLLYKKKVWKKSYVRAQMRPLWLLLTGKATARSKNSKEYDAVKIGKMVRIKHRLEFNCKLEVIFDLREDLPSDGALGTSAKLMLNDESFGRGKKNRATKLRFLVAVYEKLAKKYINLRVKQWLAYCCKELEYPKFDSDLKKLKRKAKGHPRWKKFRMKWKRLGRC